MKIRVVITVSGKVQGVGFRRCAGEAALRHGVAGWVKNLYNGDVQMCVEGDRRRVRSLIEWCRKGPYPAVIERITIEPSVFRGEFTEFVII
jgi:acylphosphatase